MAPETSQILPVTSQRASVGLPWSAYEGHGMPPAGCPPSRWCRCWFGFRENSIVKAIETGGLRRRHQAPSMHGHLPAPRRQPPATRGRQGCRGRYPSVLPVEARRLPAPPRVFRTARAPPAESCQPPNRGFAILGWHRAIAAGRCDRPHGLPPPQNAWPTLGPAPTSRQAPPTQRPRALGAPRPLGYGTPPARPSASQCHGGKTRETTQPHRWPWRGHKAKP